MRSGSQDIGRARRNDRGPQKGGDPTFINALVNGEVAPIPDLRAVAAEQGFNPKLPFVVYVDVGRP